MEPLSAEERVALAYCGPRGIPVTVFLGRRQGLGDPAWNDRDRFAALEWLAEEDTRCPGCGFLRQECMPATPEDEDRMPGYHAELLTCLACEARDMLIGQIREGGGGHGLHITLRRMAGLVDGDLAIDG